MQFEFNGKIFRSPAMIFIMYVLAGSLLILAFRAIFPGEASPLPIFADNWRLIRGALDIIALFPALAFSALVIPFGIASHEDYYTTFSPRLFQRLIPPLVTAICAAAVYALLFLLVLPLVQNYEENLRYRGEVYRMAKDRAYTHARAGEWLEASQLIGICDSAWKDSPELTDLRAEIEINLDSLQFTTDNRPVAPAANPASAAISAMPGQREPLNAADAIALGQAAFDEGKLFDAHWYATIGGRLAKTGSPESTIAAQLAARAWNQIEAQRPTRSENRAHALFQQKMSGYEAMISGDWIRAFYILQEFVLHDYHDPDAEQFLAASEKGTKEIAFFIDEMELSPGQALTGVIFSLQSVQGREHGRSVMRVDSLSSTVDYAYGMGIEYMAFDSNARLLLSLQAPYAKFLPITIDGQHQVLVLMRALDRHDSSRRWEPEWHEEDAAMYHPATAQITLDVSYETFLAISEMRQRLPGLHIDELFNAANIAEELGYIPEVFEAEILNRFGTCMFFLPMAVVAIIIGWCFRTRERPRYLFVLMLPILPLVFNGMVYLYRIVLNTVGISLILSLGFAAALPAFIVILSIVFIFSLILLAAQHG